MLYKRVKLTRTFIFDLFSLEFVSKLHYFYVICSLTHKYVIFTIRNVKYNLTQNI